MRGKLRDKRANSQRDSFRRDGSEQRRPYRRDSRNALWMDEDDDYSIDTEELYEQEEELQLNNAISRA